MIQPRKIFMLRCLAMLLWAPFCGVSAAGQTSGFVYVASNWSYDVSAYTMDGTTGGLTLVSGSPFSAGTQEESNRSLRVYRACRDRRIVCQSNHSDLAPAAEQASTRLHKTSQRRRA